MGSVNREPEVHLGKKETKEAQNAEARHHLDLVGLDGAGLCVQGFTTAYLISKVTSQTSGSGINR